MKYTQQDVLQFVEENNVRFIKLTFSDLFGSQKNISINSCELRKAFSDGVPFDASNIKGFMNFKSSDLLLFPDASTLTLLPWRPQQGGVARLYCDIKYIDRTEFDGDTRNILKKAVSYAKDKGYSFSFGTSCEFYLFRCDENGYPTKTPVDYAGYLDASPIDRGENVRRDICLTMEQMDIIPESSCHEGGPGQNEVDFKYSDPLNAADNLLSFKSVVKNIADKNGLYASFIPKPFENKSGNGLHIGMTIEKDGKEILNHFSYGVESDATHSLSGILNHVGEMSIFLNPTINSYKRFGEYLAPKYISWSHKNLSQLVRLPLDKNRPARIILRSPDCACNPYLAFALLIYACIDGNVENKKLREPIDVDLANATADELTGIETLPLNMSDAIKASTESTFLTKYLPKELVDFYLSKMKNELEDYENDTDKDKYFNKLFLEL